MANYLATDTDLTAVAAAIRTKGGTSASLEFPSGFVTAIENIPTGGTPVLQTKTKSYTPTESAQSEQVTYDTGYDGLEKVNVSVGAINSEYVGSDVPRRASSSLTASGATVTAPSGYYANSASKSISSGSATPAASISGTGATISTGSNTLTLSKTVSNTPQVTAGYISSGTSGNTSVSLSATVNTIAGTTHHPQSTSLTLVAGSYLTGNYTINGVTTTNLSAENIKNGVVVKVGDSSDDDCVVSVTGTYEGGGGESKNTQVVQGTTRTTSSTLTAIGAEMTVSKTGTYDVYWTAFRSSTSASYTYGTQLYIGGTAYGTQNTTWTNHVQNSHLTNVSLTANQKVRVYGRNSRGSSYYIYAPQLTIVET